MIPYPIIYTDAMADYQGGYTKGPLVYIRPKYKGDQGLIAHEVYGHALMWWLTLGLIGLLNYWRPVRLWSEVRAFKIQMKYGLSLEKAAEFLCRPNYDFHLTIDEAKEMLK